MFREFLINIAIITAVLFILSRILKNIKPKLLSAIKVKLLIGASLGLLGIITMNFTIPVTSTVITDLRQITIIVSAIIAGLPAAFVTGIIIILARIILFGGITESSILVAANIMTTSLLSGIIARTNWHPKLKWVLMNITGLITVLLTFYLLIDDKAILLKVLVSYSLATIIAAVFVGFLLEYLIRSNRLEATLKESEERYRKLIELLPDAVIVFTGQKIVFSNHVANELLAGSTNNSIVNLNMLNFIHPSSMELTLKRQKILFSSKEANLEIVEEKFVSLDKQVIDVEVNSSPIMYQDKPSVLTVFRDISERKIAEEELKEANKKLAILSYTDGLTGIANRRIFDETLIKEWNICKRMQVPISLIMFDIDFFKLYNDTYGHDGGDECLKKVAAAANQIVQRPDDLVARYGGEEFSIILPNTNENGAHHIAEKLLFAIRDLHIPHIHSKICNSLTISIGVATCIPSDVEDPDRLLKYADKALYFAKNSGRNQVQCYIKHGLLNHS